MRKRALSKEITLILFFKVCVLMGLWYFCFSKPVEKQLTPESMSQHLLSPTLMKE